MAGPGQRLYMGFRNKLLRAIGFVSEVQTTRLATQLARTLGTRFDIAELSVTIDEHGAAECTYVLSKVQAGTTRQIALDLQNVNCVLIRLLSRGEVVGTWRPRRSAHIIDLPPGIGSTLEVSISMLWPRTGAEPHYGLAVPDDLPWPLSDGTSGHRRLNSCRTTIVVPPGAGLNVGGVFLGGNALRPEKPVAAIVAPSAVDQLSAFNCLLFSEGFTKLLDSGSRTRVVNLSWRVYQSISDLLGISVVSRCLVKAPDENVGPAIVRDVVAFNATPETFGIGTVDEPRDFELALKMAGPWWGGAITVLGEDGFEYEMAIRAHVALHWVQFVSGSSSRDAIIQNFRGSSRRGALARFFDTAEHRLDSARVAELILTLERCSKNQSAWPQPLRELTRSCWGTAIHSTVVDDWIESLM